MPKIKVTLMYPLQTLSPFQGAFEYQTVCFGAKWYVLVPFGDSWNIALIQCLVYSNSMYVRPYVIFSNRSVFISSVATFLCALEFLFIMEDPLRNSKKKSFYIRP